MLGTVFSVAACLAGADKGVAGLPPVDQVLRALKTGDKAERMKAYGHVATMGPAAGRATADLIDCMRVEVKQAVNAHVDIPVVKARVRKLPFLGDEISTVRMTTDIEEFVSRFVTICGTIDLDTWFEGPYKADTHICIDFDEMSVQGTRVYGPMTYIYITHERGGAMKDALLAAKQQGHSDPFVRLKVSLEYHNKARSWLYLELKDWAFLAVDGKSWTPWRYDAANKCTRALAAIDKPAVSPLIRAIAAPLPRYAKSNPLARQARAIEWDARIQFAVALSLMGPEARRIAAARFRKTRKSARSRSVRALADVVYKLVR